MRAMSLVPPSGMARRTSSLHTLSTGQANDGGDGKVRQMNQRAGMEVTGSNRRTRRLTQDCVLHCACGVGGQFWPGV
eukprot:4977488-Pyramimonas_sp.AAC.2